MTFTTFGYALFFTVTALLYYWLPARFQNSVLLLASLFFYGFSLPAGNPMPLVLLLASCVFIFFMAQAIARAEGAARKRRTAVAIVICLMVLAVFKYYNYFVPTVLGITSFARLALPLGISFYTFAAISYLVDVSRGDMPACDDFIAFSAFLTFFATITSGPICRAKKVLPQLAAARRFDAQHTADALRLLLVGCFRWVAVANVLGLYVNEVFGNLEQYSGLTLPFAAVLYALQLYFEFSGYSDIARGCALLLGLDIPVNFKTPYFATNFSGFWSRWHISLSSWLQDYLFMPLVWGRWTSHIPVLGKRVTKPPMISSVAVVFLLSGFWHGNTWPFVVWGCLQAAYRVGEELLHQWYKKPAKKPKLALRIFKTVSVFVLWSASLVFFRIGLLPDGSVQQGFSFFARQFSGVSLSAFFAQTVTAVENGFYVRPIMVVLYCTYLLFVLGIAFYADWHACFRAKDASPAVMLAKQKLPVRWLIYYALLSCILLGFIMQSGGFGTVSFAYAGF